MRRRHVRVTSIPRQLGQRSTLGFAKHNGGLENVDSIGCVLEYGRVKDAPGARTGYGQHVKGREDLRSSYTPCRYTFYRLPCLAQTMSTVDALSVIHEPRIYRIRILREAYSALQQDLPLLAERIYLLRVVVGESIGYVAQSVNIDPDLLPKHCCDLGTALLDRFRHLRERKDLDEAEAYFRLVLRHYPLNPSHVTSNSLLLLGAVLRERAYETKGAQAAAEALAIHRQLYTDHKRPAVSILERAHQARELGWTLNMFHRVNKAEDSVLFESIERLKEAEALFVEAQAADHICLLGLCDVLGFVYVVQPDKAHVEDSISYGERALKTCGPDHRDVFWIARRLAHMRASFAFYYDDLRSLNQGIDLFREALVNAPPRWKIVLSTYLADALQLRYWKQRKEEDLTEILTISSALVTNMTPDDVGWGKLQECLCNMWLVRFQSTGRPEDIEAAAQAAHLAGAAIAVGTVVHAFRLIQLVECRLHQFEAFGDVNHLNECIEILERITQPDAVHSTHWKEAARRLLRAYYLRYKTAGDLTDLDQATVLLPILNSNHDHEEDMNRQYALSIAGHILLARFMVTGTREDLEQATVLHQKALNCEVSYNNHQVVSAFTTTLRVRYETLHEEDSLARAVVLQKATADALPEVHLDRAEVLCGLGWLRLCLHRAEGHIGEALDDLLGALKSVYCPAHSRLKHVWDVLTYLAKEMPEALDQEDAVKLSAVYSTAIDLLPQAASFDLEPRIRLEVIAGAGQLTIQGATHAISIDRLNLALEMLEAGRSVFWTQSLRLRTPFTDLPKTIGNRLSKITYALARPIVEEADRERELLRRRQLGDEFQTVLAEARAVPGFENLLRNASFEALARAAKNHPMVVLLTGEASGHAIIIYGDSETHLVPLPQVTAKGLQTLSLRIEAHTKSVRSTDLRGIRRVPAKTQPPDVYRELWTLIMRPIVEALQWRVSSCQFSYARSCCLTLAVEVCGTGSS
jgi:tetratricopeptide (TPR) repeat protein